MACSRDRVKDTGAQRRAEAAVREKGVTPGYLLPPWDSSGNSEAIPRTGTRVV